MKGNIRIGDNEYCVACNMNAIMDFLQERGTDDFSALSDFSKLKPTDMLPLLAACIREGERLEGRECNISSKEIGAMADFGVLTSFLEIFGKAMAPAITPEEKK